MGARAINAIVGTWLFVSAFLWPHTYGETENAWVVGFMAVIMALGGLSGLGWTRFQPIDTTTEPRGVQAFGAGAAVTLALFLGVILVALLRAGRRGRV